MRRRLAVIAAVPLLIAGCSAATDDAPAPTPSAASPSASASAEATPEAEPAGPKVPDVVGMDAWSALQELEAAGFEVQCDSDGEEEIPTDILDVVGHEPAPGHADVGRIVTIEMAIPPLPSSEREERESLIILWVDAMPSEREARWMVWREAQDAPDGEPRFLAINCREGSTDTYDNRLYNSRFESGRQETEVVAGATCP